ncbi:NUDIX hydrolase [Nocardioides sp. CFH 31398]|uniref:NUDIX hydrolase n=1 Tax=Nocardioides sp. CFH 31398 TaxID=2919579 RepID=UPI001F0628E2|nr:NUDIX domain-containing protein [Nocardioides sp. CFH 31398]MCH1866513.1 NUDIX domain-containing protein [Nocardioides sp. CFH 31398]
MSLHADALAVLGGWAAPDDAQEVLRRRYVGHLVRHPDGLERTCLPDHLTASTLVTSPDGSRVLLTLHARAGRWFQLGGHCEPVDTTLAGAALREATEESGLGSGLTLDPVPLQLSEHAVPFCGPRPATDDDRAATTHHLDVRFIAVADPDAPLGISDESADLRWWTADDLPDPDPDMLHLVALARARL